MKSGGFAGARRMLLNVVPGVMGITLLLGMVAVFQGLSFDYVNSKAVVIDLGMLLVFAIGIVAVGQRELREMRSSHIVQATLVFLGVTLAATLSSIDRTVSWYGHLERATGTFPLLLTVPGAFMGVFMIKRLGSIRGDILYPISIAGGILGISTLVGNGGLNWVHGAILGPSSLGGGYLGNSSFAGTMLMIGAFVTAYLFVTAKTRVQKWLLALVGLVTLVNPILVNDRILSLHVSGLFGPSGLFGQAHGAVLSLGIGALLAVGVFLAGSGRSRIWKGAGVFLSVAVVTVTVAALVMLSVPKPNAVNRAFAAQTGNGRFMYWGMAVRTFRDHPVLGTGPETFRYANQRYFDPRLIETNEYWSDKPHNAYLELLASSGVLGLAAYLLLIAACVSALWHLGMKKDGEYRPFVATFSGFLFAYLVNNFIVFDIPSSYLVFFVMVAWLAAQERSLFFADLSGLSKDSKAQKREQQEKGGARSEVAYGLWAAGRIMVAVAITVAGSVIIGGEIHKLSLVRSEMLLPSGLRADTYRRSEDASPYGSGIAIAERADQYSGQYISHLGEIRSADLSVQAQVLKDVSALRLAVLRALSRYPETSQGYLALAQLALTKIAVQNHADTATLKEVLDAGHAMVRLSPRNPRGYWILGQASVYAGDLQGAYRFFQQAFDLDPDLRQSQENMDYIRGLMKTPH